MSGIGIVDIRGKIQGTVMSKGRSGAIARVKVVPVNRQTPLQQETRIRFGFFSSDWRSLTPDQINAWNAAASSGFPTNNVFGNPIHLSGINLYTALNTNLNTAGVGSISNPPIAEVVESPLSIAPAAAAGADTFFVNGTWDGGTDVVPANTFLIVRASPPVSNGVSFVKSQLRFVVGIDAAGDTGTTDIQTEYEAQFGALVAGQKIFVETIAINKTTGQAGPPLKQSLIVAA